MRIFFLNHVFDIFVISVGYMLKTVPVLQPLFFVHQQSYSQSYVVRPITVHQWETLLMQRARSVLVCGHLCIAAWCYCVVINWLTAVALSAVMVISPALTPQSKADYPCLEYCSMCLTTAWSLVFFLVHILFDWLIFYFNNTKSLVCHVYFIL